MSHISMMAQSRWWLPRNILGSSEFKYRKHSCSSWPSVLSWQFLIKYSSSIYYADCWQWPRTLGPPDRKQKGTILLVQQICFGSFHKTSTVNWTKWFDDKSLMTTAVDKLYSGAELPLLQYWKCYKWSSGGCLVQSKLKPLKPNYLFIFVSK